MSPYQIGSHVRPCDGEAVSGDAIVVKQLPDGVFLSLIDALGHGRGAAEVALVAIRFLKQNASAEIEKVLTKLHDHLVESRGAMVSIAFANNADGTITCTGIGNAVMRRIGSRDETFPSPDGIVGVRFRSPRVYRRQMAADELFLMHSDGVAESLSSALASPLVAQPVDMLARRIVLDHGRPYDDAACILVRYQP